MELEFGKITNRNANMYICYFTETVVLTSGMAVNFLTPFLRAPYTHTIIHIHIKCVCHEPNKKNIYGDKSIQKNKKRGKSKQNKNKK